MSEKIFMSEENQKIMNVWQIFAKLSMLRDDLNHTKNFNQIQKNSIPENVVELVSKFTDGPLSDVIVELCDWMNHNVKWE